MRIELKHIIELCQLIYSFELKNKYLPYIVASPNLIQTFVSFPDTYKELEIFKGIMQVYRTQKGTYTYQNGLMPPGLLVFKTHTGIIAHRIFDNTEKHIKEDETDTTRKSIFAAAKFKDLE
jgi:hypothetical protein